jgi:hypothetical protein
MSSDKINPGKHHTLIFDIAKTNTSNGNSKFSGLFTAPDRGLYALICSITMSGTGSYASYAIIKKCRN